MRLVRKLIKVIVLIAIGIVALSLVLSPALSRIAEYKLEMDCLQPSPSDVCKTRMRAMGHVWSSKGDFARAERWYKLSAENGDEASMFHLAWIYQQRAMAMMIKLITDTPEARLSFAATMELAMQWYKKSADKGYAPAMNNLGQLYLHGNGKVQDETEAFEWELKAAQAGNPVGSWNVMLAYMAGMGVTANQDEAKKWSWWDPKKCNPMDVSSPTLDRTMLHGTEIPAHERAIIKEAAKEGVPIQLEFSPLKPNASIPTFEQATSKIRE